MHPSVNIRLHFQLSGWAVASGVLCTVCPSDPQTPQTQSLSALPIPPSLAPVTRDPFSLDRCCHQALPRPQSSAKTPPAHPIFSEPLWIPVVTSQAGPSAPPLTLHHCFLGLPQLDWTCRLSSSRPFFPSSANHSVPRSLTSVLLLTSLPSLNLPFSLCQTTGDYLPLPPPGGSTLLQ